MERAKTVENEEKMIAELKRLEEEAADRRDAEKERQDAEAAKRREEESKKAARQKSEATAAKARVTEAAVAVQKARPEPFSQKSVPAPAPAIQQSTLTTRPTQDTLLEAEHSRYLEIHRSLKDLRKFMTAQAKQNASLKGAMGDMRRGIRKSVGQLRDGKGANRVQVFLFVFRHFQGC